MFKDMERLLSELSAWTPMPKRAVDVFHPYVCTGEVIDILIKQDSYYFFDVSIRGQSWHVKASIPQPELEPDGDTYLRTKFEGDIGRLGLFTEAGWNMHECDE